MSKARIVIVRHRAAVYRKRNKLKQSTWLNVNYYLHTDIAISNRVIIIIIINTYQINCAHVINDIITIV